MRDGGEAGVDKKFKSAQDSNTHFNLDPVTCLWRLKVNFTSISEMWYLEVCL